MNKYVKIGLVGFVVGVLLTVGYHLYKKNNPYDGKYIKPTSKMETMTNIEEHPYTLIKTNKTMA